MSKATQQAKDTAYRVYVTDCLKLIAENTGNISLKLRYYDKKKKKKVDNRTGDEIVADIIKRAGLVVKSE